MAEEKIKCVVKIITYHNSENGYSVLKVAEEDKEENIAVIGYFLGISVGKTILIEGEWVVDAKYGKQFRANRWRETVPSTLDGIEKYLGSGAINGIGPKYAKKIVQTFGLNTLSIIENNTDRLAEIPGIKKKKIAMIKESWEKQAGIAELMLFLQQYGVSISLANKIYKKYGPKSIEKIRENPYRIAEDIWGVGFKTADELGAKLGIDKNAFIRLKSGVKYVLNERTRSGDIYLEFSQLVAIAIKMLKADKGCIIMTIDQLCKDRELIKEKIQIEEWSMEEQKMVLVSKYAIYLPILYYAETGIANNLKNIQKRKIKNLYLSNTEIDVIQKKLNISYDDIQKMAIQKAGTEKVMVLTGGPGTGKTTTLQGIITAYKMRGLSILLAAPTGRAAKRMSETTGMEAKTIHRLLGYTGTGQYLYNEEEQLEGDVLIVDESSMIDIPLMHSLLKAVPLNMRILLVGDIDQLPSVGPGNVLKDIIDSGRFQVIRLTKIFRQAQESLIVTNAHRINKGELPVLKKDGETDFFFANIEDPEAAASYIISLVSKKLPQAYAVSPEEIQVLSPMRKGELGTTYMNQRLQEAINPTGPELFCNGVIFRKRDKVMQIVNNYEKNVFNGDIGIIEKIDTDHGIIVVNFDGLPAVYKKSEAEELTHAYATTIHKSQGSGATSSRMKSARTVA